jgi:hypothetical protein
MKTYTERGWTPVEIMERHWDDLALTWWLEENTLRHYVAFEGMRIETKTGEFAMARPYVYWFEDSTEAMGFKQKFGIAE